MSVSQLGGRGPREVRRVECPCNKTTTSQQVKLPQPEIGNLSPISSSRLTGCELQASLLAEWGDITFHTLQACPCSQLSITSHGQHSHPSHTIHISLETLIIHNGLCLQEERMEESPFRQSRHKQLIERPQNYQSSFQSLIVYWVITTQTTATSFSPSHNNARRLCCFSDHVTTRHHVNLWLSATHCLTQLQSCHHGPLCRPDQEQQNVYYFISILDAMSGESAVNLLKIFWEYNRKMTYKSQQRILPNMKPDDS